MRLNNKFFIIILISIFISLFIFAGIASADRLAVMGFESKGLSWTDSEVFERQVLEIISANYSSKLDSENIIEVADNFRVNEILKEMDYLPGDKIELSDAVQVARMVESNLFILGSLEKIEIGEKDDVSLGPLSYTEIEAEVVLNASLVDTQTGEVITTYSATANETDRGLELDDLNNISIGSEAFTDSAIFKAIDSALNKLVEDTVSKKEMFEQGNEFIKADPIQAEVAAKVGKNLIINKGSEDGVREKQIGKLERQLEMDSGELSIIYLGEIVVSSVDSNSSLLRVNEPIEEPEAGDTVTIEPDNNIISQQDFSAIDFPSNYIKKVETSDFIINIDQITRTASNVSFQGTAEAKNEDTELTLFLPANYEFFDHQGERREASAEQVKIGSAAKSASYKLTELILEDYPQTISWEFSGVPEAADHLALVILYLETPAAGEVEITLEDISLTD